MGQTEKTEGQKWNIGTLQAESLSIFPDKSAGRVYFPLPELSRQIERDSARRVEHIFRIFVIRSSIAGYGACIPCHLLLFQAQLPFLTVPFAVLNIVFFLCYSFKMFPRF